MAAHPHIRLAALHDTEAISAMVLAERFQEDGSGALLPVREDQVRGIISDARLGAFYVADGGNGELAGCVAVVVYGLPHDYERAMASLKHRLAEGTFKLPPTLVNGFRSLEGDAGNVTVAELRSLVVSDNQRGKGLGAVLIEAAKAEAKSRGFAELYSLTNEHTVPLFERYGFKRAERTPQKLVVDCAACPILERCNEVPVVAVL